MYSLIVTAKLNDVDPRGWLAHVRRTIADQPSLRLHELLSLELAQSSKRHRHSGMIIRGARQMDTANGSAG